MAGRISRRKLASYFSTKIKDGKISSAVFLELAAYLRLTRRTREAELIARDIEDILAQKGTVIASVTSAHSLTDAERNMIKKMLNAKQIFLREEVEPTVLGGVRIDIPGGRYDATLRRRLDALKVQQL